MKFRRMAFLLAPVVVLALVGVCGWEQRHPTAFRVYDGRTTAELTRPLPDGSHYFGMSWNSDGGRVITARSAAAKVATNSARAKVEVLICEVKPRPNGSLVGVVSDHDIDKLCELKPIADTKLRLPGTSSTQLVLKVTPHQRGRVLVQGVDLSYSEGWRSGTQRIGQRVDFRVGDHS